MKVTNKETSLPVLIRTYEANCMQPYIDELERCREKLHSSALSDTEKGRCLLTGHHQRRMQDKDNVSRVLGNARLWERKFDDFEALHSAVKETIIDLYTVGPCAVYDVAVRIGYSFGIVPERRVYVQRGALDGARKLLGEPKLPVGSVERERFDKLLPGMSALHIENFLCIMKSFFPEVKKE